MKKVAVVVGTVIEGTLQSNELIAAFAAELERMGAGDERLLTEAKAWLADPVDAETGSELVAALIDRLNNYAPDGYYFGAHWGDGADFGYWPVEE